MRPKPRAEFLIDVRRAWERAAAQGRDAQKQVILDACAKFTPPYSYSHMTRMANLGARKRSLSEEQTINMEELDSVVKKVFDFKQMANFNKDRMKIKKAFEALKRHGDIPDHITLKQVYDRGKKINIKMKSYLPWGKYRGPDHPLGQLQVDYSKSTLLYFNPKTGQIYVQPGDDKRKDEYRLMIGLAVDYMSRVIYIRYYRVIGESTEFVCDHLLNTFERKNEFSLDTGEISNTFKALLQGKPKSVSFDRGGGNIANATKNLLAGLGIKIIKGTVQKNRQGANTNKSNSRARGAIERVVETFKYDLEADILADYMFKQCPPDMTLDDINEIAEAFCIKYNKKSHPILTDSSRWELFEPGLASAKFTDDADKNFANGWYPRKVIDGLIAGNRKGQYFIAPDFASNGDILEVSFVMGDCFVLHNGEHIKLKPQAGSVRDLIERETEETMYEGFTLAERFSEELDVISGGELNKSALHDDLKDDVADLFRRPRSAAEIKEKVNYFVDYTLKRQRQPANVIFAPLP